MIDHREDVSCPCRPEVRDALGGGRVLVHRVDGRQAPDPTAPDRLCHKCGQWHLLGHEHLR